MTFSICARERDGEGFRFGVAVTTRLPAVGTLCPFVSDHGAVATQSHVNVELGRRGVAYLDDGLAIDDALSALLAADDDAPSRQLHGVDRNGSFAFSGDDCGDWFGHRQEEGYTVAGNLLVGEAVVEETAAAYERGIGDDAPFVERLLDALAAGQAAGGDRRTELRVGSAAVRVARTDEDEAGGLCDDLRVDASETPVADLRATYELAREGVAELVARQDGEDDEGEGDDGEDDE